MLMCRNALINTVKIVTMCPYAFSPQHMCNTTLHSLIGVLQKKTATFVTKHIALLIYFIICINVLATSLQHTLITLFSQLSNEYI